MLEEIENRFILTDAEGRLLGCYSEIDSAEMDAKDLVENKDEDYNIFIYELLTAQKIGEPYLQKIYEKRKTIPEAEEEEKKEDEEEEKKE
jgi:hypothetical protein